MCNREEVIRNGIEFYQKYSDTFLTEVEKVYNSFYEVSPMYGGYDPKYGHITQIHYVTNSYVYVKWSERRFGGYDEGVSKIPIEWVINTEEELKRFKEELYGSC